MSEALPQFNFGTVNRQWQLMLARMDTKLSRLSSKYDALNSDLTSSEDEIDAAWEALIAANEKRDAMLCQVIVDVPREWLLDEAPKKLDWTDPGSMNYVRADRNTQLMQMVMERLQNPAGKSETP